MRFQTRTLLGISITIFLSFVLSCVKDRTQLEWAELLPILNQNNLSPSDPLERHREITEIEEADSKLYGPLAGRTIYLESTSPTLDSEGLRPRYWLRVEDYSTAATAAKRASEYRSVGTYERLEKAYGKADSFSISKTSVRGWAIARGKRVYALTTDTNLFTLIETPENLRMSVARLPET